MKDRKLEFEDTTVTGLDFSNAQLTVDYSRYEEDKDTDHVGRIIFTGVKNFTIDDLPADKADMFYNDGEIIHFELNDDKALIIIQWNDFPKPMRKMMAYKFEFLTMQAS